MKIELIRRIEDYLYCEDDQDNAYKIEINDLEKFLEENDCYEWSLDTVDHTGEHQQYSGKMNFNDWVNSNYANIDLVAYLETKKINNDHDKIMLKIDELIAEIKNLKS